MYTWPSYLLSPSSCSPTLSDLYICSVLHIPLFYLIFISTQSNMFPYSIWPSSRLRSCCFTQQSFHLPFPASYGISPNSCSPYLSVYNLQSLQVSLFLLSFYPILPCSCMPVIVQYLSDKCVCYNGAYKHDLYNIVQEPFIVLIDEGNDSCLWWSQESFTSNSP